MQTKHIATLGGLVVLILATLLIPQLAGSNGSGVQALEIDGVWVFEHGSPDAADALHSGDAEIADGCLLVEGAAVIWHSDQIDQVAETIEAIQSGQARTLSIAGGGISLEEGASELPAVVLDRCNVTEVWFAAP